MAHTHPTTYPQHYARTPVYETGCAACIEARWLEEHRLTRGEHYGLNGPGSSARTDCPRCRR